MNKSKVLRYLLYTFSFLGLLISVYLWSEYSKEGDVTCQLTGSGCQDVRTSSYSSFLGMSLPIWGSLYYTILMLYSLSLFFTRKIWKWEPLIALFYLLGGFIFSLYLTYLEFFVIQAICQWCVGQALMNTGALVMGLIMFIPLVKKIKIQER